MKSLSDSDAPSTREEYQRHYASYDSAPFAFTDIEMLFNEERAAVDWIFRYSNEALAKGEKRRIIIKNTVFYLGTPENSDSAGRTFESCRARQNAVKSYGFTAFLYLYELFLWRSLTGWG